MEPGRTNGGVVTSRGAVASLIVRAHGRTAHTGTGYKEGESAVRELAGKVERIESLSAPEKGLIANVGIFRGGEARQVVPGTAEMHVDLRAPSDDEMRELLAQLQSILLRAANPAVRILVEGGQTRPAFPRSPGVQDLHMRMAAVARDMRVSLAENHSAGGSDGSFTAALGIPTIDGLGPISFEVCSRRERVVVRSVLERSILLARSLMALG